MTIAPRAVGNAVVATTGNIVLTEPGGTSPNDFLIATIAHRGTIGYNTPAGWTKVIDESSGNTSTTANAGIGSMEVFWIRRGQSAPALNFANAGVTTVGMGRLVAYTGVSKAANPIRSTSNVTAAAASTVTTTTSNLTGSANDMLLIIGAGGADSLFSTWQIVVGSTTVNELFDSNTTSGSDTTLGLANLVLTATLNSTVRYTAADNSRNVIGGLVLAQDFEFIPAPDDVALVSYAPTVINPQFEYPLTGAVTVTGCVPVVTKTDIRWNVSWAQLTAPPTAGGANVVVMPDACAVVLAGYGPRLGVQLLPAAGSVSMTSPVPVLLINSIKLTGTGAVTLSPSVPSLDIGVRVPLGAVALQTFAPGFSVSISATVPSGAVALAGLAPTVTRTQNVVANPPTAAVALATYAPTTGASITALPGTGAISLATQVPAVVATQNVVLSPPTGLVATAGLAPKLGVGILPAAGAVSLAGYAPSIGLGNVSWRVSWAQLSAPSATGVEIIPGTGTVSLAAFTPRLDLGARVPTGQVTISGQLPTAALPGFISVQNAGITLATYAPTVTKTGILVPGTGAVSLAAYVPSAVLDRRIATPAGAVTLSGLAPAAFRTTINEVLLGSAYGYLRLITAGRASTVDTQIVPATGAVTLAGAQPRVASTATPPTAAVTLAGQVPLFTISRLALPGAGAISLATYQPAVVAIDNRFATPGTGAVALQSYAPVIAVSGNLFGNTGTVAVALVTWAPGLLVSNIKQPGEGTVALTGYIPAVIMGGQLAANPPAGAVSITGWPPLAGMSVTSQPGAGAVALQGLAPAIDKTIRITPPCGTVGLSGLPPARTEIIQQWLDGVAWGHGNVQYVADRTHREKGPTVEERPKAKVIQLKTYAPSVQVTGLHEIIPPTGRVELRTRRVISMVDYRIKFGMKLPEATELTPVDTVQPVITEEDELAEFLMMAAAGGMG